MDVVTQIVSVRAQQQDGLERMLGASTLAHAALIAIVVLGPASWFGARTVQEDENVMTIIFICGGLAKAGSYYNGKDKEY